MKKLDQFILKSFLGPFIMTFFITVFILVMQFLWMYIDELVGKGLGFWVILEFLGWGAATILPLSMPLATLLASIMTFGNMGEHNELLAIKAAGISLQRVFYPVIFVAFLISVAAFFVSNDLIPLAYNKIYTLQYDINKTKEEIKIPTGTFYNGIEGYSIRVASNNKETGMMYDVMVYNHSKNKGNISLAVADSGMIRSTPDKSALVFTLYNGVSYEETNKRSYEDTSYALQQVRFKMQEVIISLKNYAFQKSEGNRYNDQIMAKDLAQLQKDRDSLGALYDEVALNQRKNVTYALSLDYAKQLDTAKNKGYTKSFPLDSIKQGTTADQLKAVKAAIESVQRTIQKMDDYDREALQYTYYLRRIDLESLRKFTLSFACFIFFFIGAPLGAIIRKGGLGTPVIVSALFFVLYWVVDISGKKLARNGAISPEMGAFISTMVLLPIGIFLTWKSTKDSSLFDMETYMKPIKQFFKRFSFGKKVVAGSTDGSLSRRESLRIVFMGTPEIAAYSLRKLVEGGHRVVAVVTMPDKPIGRGQKMGTSAVKDAALELGLPVLQPEKLKDEAFVEELRSYEADLFVVVAFRMLPKVVWSMPDRGTFNLHTSLLPKYRGAAPINWAIIKGETTTGVSTFFLDEHMDTGKILFQSEVTIDETDDAGTLHDKLMETGGELVIKTVRAIACGDIHPVAQNAEGIAPEFMIAPKLDRSTGDIDWNASARDIFNLIRGLAPKPGAHSLLHYRIGEDDEQQMDVKIYASSCIDAERLSEAGAAHLKTGEVYTDGKSQFWVRCADGAVAITELQAPGKKRMPVASFLAGYRGSCAYFSK